MPIPASEEKRLEWKDLIEQQRQSGLSIEKWCLQNQILSHNFHYWKEKLFPKQLNKSSFTEIGVRSASSVSLQTRGLHVRMNSNCDPRLRQQLFALFAELSCWRLPPERASFYAKSPSICVTASKDWALPWNSFFQESCSRALFLSFSTEPAAIWRLFFGTGTVL